MATNFPTSADSLTNPTSSDTLDSPDHAGQHTDANDAIEAIQNALLDGAPLHIDDANERVGIGTNSPSQKLEVAGDILLNDGDIPDGGLVLRGWQANPTAYGMIGTANMTGNEYVLLTSGTNTFIGSGTGGSTTIRGPANSSSHQMSISSSQVTFTGTVKVGSDKVWHRGDLRGSATTISVNSTGYGSISHGLGQTPDFAFVGARTTLSSGGDNQLAFPITFYSSSTLTFRAYEINGNGNSNYSSSTIYNASVYIFWMAGFFS